MPEHDLIGLAAVLILGVGAQWLAWRLRLPSILLLLLLGFIAGPLTGLVMPDELLGDLLFPLVSISVAIILFEGGLSLRLRELPDIGSVVGRLITIAPLVTWAIAAVAARALLGFDWPLAVLLGSILVVTGPTVIGPLLRQIRPQGLSGTVLKWEGILIDPVGAVLAVLVFEAILAGELQGVTGFIAAGVIQTILIGVLLGLAGAALIVVMLRNFWIPDQLQNGAALVVAVGVFVASNILHPESGLLTVTIMGLALANQRWVGIRHIVEFKENLRVLLIGSLFILLAARLETGAVLNLGWAGLAFVAVLVFVARPLATFLSTWRSPLERREKLFISWMAPRGIVAAAVSSLFAFELAEAGYPGAEQLTAVTFLVIVTTVALYGLTAEPLARWLGLSEKDPQGVLFVGADPITRSLAKSLQDHGIRTILLDTNESHVQAAREDGLRVYHGNALNDECLEEINFTGIGRFLGMTANNEVNSLAALLFQEVFGRQEIYQLAIAPEEQTDEALSARLHGRFLFRDDIDYERLADWLAEDNGLVISPLAADFTYQDFQQRHGGRAVPLFLVGPRGQLDIFTTDTQPTPRAGQTLISLAPPLPDEGSELPAVTTAGEPELEQPVPRRVSTSGGQRSPSIENSE